MLHWILAGAAAAVVVTPSKELPSFDASKMDVPTLARMAQQGTVVLIDENEAGAVELVSALAVIDAPVDEVWKIVTDYEHFAEFFPQTEAADVVRREGDEIDVQFTLKFRFSVITKKIQYVVRHTLDEDQHRVRIRHISGDLKTGGGEWQLLPLDGGKRTLAVHSTISDLRAMGFLVKSLLKEQPHMEPAIHTSSASMVVAAVKRRAEDPDVKNK